jgi:hypothetical protein
MVYTSGRGRTSDEAYRTTRASGRSDTGGYMSDKPTAISIRFPPGMADTVRQRLAYGDSLNGWVIAAVRQRLERDPVQPDQAPAPDASQRRRHPMAPTVDTVDPTTLTEQIDAVVRPAKAASPLTETPSRVPGQMVASFDPDAEDGA